jgi:hypothetical protein
MEFEKLPQEVLKAVSMDVDEFLKFTKRWLTHYKGYTQHAHLSM